MSVVHRLSSREREVRRLVDGYNEGCRLMRHGDGADEWAGMSIARKNLLALAAIGRNEKGQKVDRAESAECLRSHGLREEARRVEERARCGRCGRPCTPGAYLCTSCAVWSIRSESSPVWAYLGKASDLLKVGWSAGDKRLLVIGVLCVVAAAIIAVVTR